MTHIFLPLEQFSGDTARINGSDHQHLSKVLRARPGDTVTLLDGIGHSFRATLTAVEKSETLARIESEVRLPAEPPIHISVAQALGKMDKFEQVIQHGTEAGASAFVPVRAERCVVDVAPARVPDRMLRWQMILKGAAEQSHRLRMPSIQAPQTFTEMLRTLESTQTPAVLLHPDPDAPSLHTWLETHPGLTRMAICIGPEGGWSPAEVSRALESNIASVTLGPRVLRTETAALVALSQILFGRE